MNFLIFQYPMKNIGYLANIASESNWWISKSLTRLIAIFRFRPNLITLLPR